MKTISAKVISTTPVSLSDAAAMLSDFAATETGASDAVSVYIRRTADAFNQLVQFHDELRYPNSGPKHLANEHVGDDNSEYKLNREIIAKEEEPLKAKQSPEVKHHKKKHKKQGDDKNEALVKPEPDSVATEEHRKNGAEKVKNEDKVKSKKGLNSGEEDRVGILDDGKYQENAYKKVKTGSSMKNEPELDVVEVDSMKKKDKKKKKKEKNLSEGNEGVGRETLVAERKKRKSGDIDGSNEQNSKKKKSKKQRV